MGLGFSVSLGSGFRDLGLDINIRNDRPRLASITEPPASLIYAKDCQVVCLDVAGCRNVNNYQYYGP